MAVGGGCKRLTSPRPISRRIHRPGELSVLEALEALKRGDMETYSRLVYGFNEFQLGRLEEFLQ